MLGSRTNNDTAVSKAHSTRNWPWKKRSPSASVYLSLSERKISGPRKSFQLNMNENTKMIPRAGRISGRHMRQNTVKVFRCP